MVFFLFGLFFLLGMFCLSSFQSALRSLDQRNYRIQLNNLMLYLPYASLLKKVGPASFSDGLHFSLSAALHVARLFAILFFVLFFLQNRLFLDSIPVFPWPYGVLSLVLFVLSIYGFGDFLPRLLGIQHAEKILHSLAWPASFFLFLSFPLTYPFLTAAPHFLDSIDLEQYHEPLATTNQEIMEIIEEANVSQDLNPHDLKLIASVVRFRERIAREVMVPRVDLFTLPASMSIREAAKLLDEEGFSRVPVYQESVDEIIGVLMHKDILKQYMIYEQKGNAQQILEAPIEKIVKNVLYSPETKKISQLLQEFRKRQVHLAIVVDEYGGTEGIVTIEDILEEIVGEIEDEYDVDESLFLTMPDGSWLVDGRMSILDVAEELHVKIPQDGDYDTIGGFIFHRTGMIPPKGYVLTEDAFVIEVLRSDDRRVEKVRISPRKVEIPSRQEG